MIYIGNQIFDHCCEYWVI